MRPLFFTLKSLKFSGTDFRGKRERERSVLEMTNTRGIKSSIQKEITMASICSRIFMNCSAATLTLWSSLLKASAWRSLAKKPCRAKKRGETSKKRPIWRCFSPSRICGSRSSVPSTPRPPSPASWRSLPPTSQCLSASSAQLLPPDCSVCTALSVGCAHANSIRGGARASYPFPDHHEFAAVFDPVGGKPLVHLLQRLPWRKKNMLAKNCRRTKSKKIQK